MTLRPNLWRLLPFAVLAAAGAGCGIDSDPTAPDHLSGAPRAVGTDDLDAELNRYLSEHGFTGRVGATLEARLGRPVDRRLADLGRLLWFDPITGLNDDNSCAGCHSPTNGFGDTQPIAIGIENNGIVGPDRRGPRNQRRSPLVLTPRSSPR